MNKRDEFKAEFVFIDELGFDPMIVYTHAWHESGGFKRIIGNYNFWGIKCPRKWTGKKVLVNTHEYIKGVRTPTTEYFCDWPDLKGAILWYTGLISRLYPEAYNARTDHKIFFPALVNFKYKYATDPLYPELLIKLYEQLIV